MTKDVSIRLFDPKKDWDQFVELNYQTFWDSIPEDEKIPVAQFQKIHSDLLKRYMPEDPQRCHVTVASSEDDSYMGHCWVGAQSDFFTTIFNPWVFDLSVRPEFRAKGIGRLLLEDCVKRCKDLGYASLNLQVLGHNEAALRFYEKCGFSAKAHAMIRKL